METANELINTRTQEVLTEHAPEDAEAFDFLLAEYNRLGERLNRIEEQRNQAISNLATAGLVILGGLISALQIFKDSEQVFGLSLIALLLELAIGISSLMTGMVFMARRVELIVRLEFISRFFAKNRNDIGRLLPSLRPRELVLQDETVRDAMLRQSMCVKSFATWYPYMIWNSLVVAVIALLWVMRLDPNTPPVINLVIFLVTCVLVTGIQVLASRPGWRVLVNERFGTRIDKPLAE